MKPAAPDLLFRTARLIAADLPGFMKNPAPALSAVADHLAHLNPTLSARFRDAAESPAPTQAELSDLVSELNIFLAESRTPAPGDSERLGTPLSTIKGLGEKSLEALEKTGITTVHHAITHFPHRYEVYKTGLPIGEKQVLAGVLESHGQGKTRRGKRFYKAVLRGSFGYVAGVWFHFNRKYPASILKTGETYRFYGATVSFDGMPAIFHPDLVDESVMGTVVPVYSVPKPVKQKSWTAVVHRLLNEYLDDVPDTLPGYLAARYNFPPIRQAIRTIHLPPGDEDLAALTDGRHPAVKRFVYDELFYLQLGLLMKKKAYAAAPGIGFEVKREWLDEVKNIMPFRLTDAQRRVLAAIFNDMKRPSQMNRLVQGDVGSGKTIVAFVAGLIAAMNGHQVAVIAPTEVLAEQHYTNLTAFLAGSSHSAVLMTGSMSKSAKDEAKSMVAAHHASFVVGTHAVIQENVGFDSLGMAIIDEQHRFGVVQRKALIDKGHHPDILLMSATPIPRTLSMTFYGDLEMSIIDELPPGRRPIITKAFPDTRLTDAFAFIQKEIDKGHKAFFIYPLIDESEKVSLKAATKSVEAAKAYFGEDRVGLLHGRMKPEEKRNLMQSFKDGDISVLVSTTVVEVGVDIPDATVMLIENAENFGLSQLHQLRGRVGRSDRQSYCLLVHGAELSEDGRTRIDAMVHHTSGFKLSEIDLAMRGPGDFFGTKQSGLPELRFSHIVRDQDILITARQDAAELLESDPELQDAKNAVVKREMLSRWQERIGLAGIG